MDSNLQTTAGPALIESNVSRVAEEVIFDKGSAVGQLSMRARHVDNLHHLRTAASRISGKPFPSSSTLLGLGKSVPHLRPKYDGIPVEVYQFRVADDLRSIEREGPEYTVIEIEGFPDNPFASGTFQNAFKAKMLTPCRFLPGTDFVFKQHNIYEYGVSKENDIMQLTEESLKEIERENERKTAKEVQVAAVGHSLCYCFTQECNTKMNDFGREISVIQLMHVKLKSGQFPPWGSMEPYIQGRWRKFINNDGQVVDVGKHPSEEVVEFSKKSLAFSHWTYTKFDKKALVCDLQGADFQLTDLEIASSDSSLFGMGNLSDYALKMFKRNHKCNEYCAALELEGNQSPET